VDRNDVLVLEDEPAVAEVLESYLRRDGFRPVMCGTVAAARAALSQAPPEIMILDIGLPDGSGLDVLRDAAACGKHVPAIMLTAHGDESDRVVGLELGADDYVTKPFSPRELMARVRALLRRAERAPVPALVGQVMRIGRLEIDLAAHEVRIDRKPTAVTPTEFRILAILASSPGEAFTRTALLDRLNDTGKIFERTLDRHINNLRKKIELDSREPTYIVTVYGVGYKVCRD
jgi:two-component system, OmpR family, alkaline phosphatase synthesis response regulator PhoP